jgi:hypothetical protein
MYQSVDVSWPQNNYTPDAAETGVIVAATSGDGGTATSGLFTQSTFVEDILNCRNAGKPAGFYHFNGPQDANASADFFWAVIKPYYKRGDVLGLDIESGSGFGAQSPAWAAAFAIRLATNIGISTHQLRLLIYGNRSTMGGPGWGALETMGCLLWLASPGGYPENTPVGEWSHWTVLQYSTAGNIDRDESELSFAEIAGNGVTPMTPEEHNWLLNLYQATFTGGDVKSLPDGGKSLAASLAQIHTELNSVFAGIFQGGSSMPDAQQSIGASLANLDSLIKALPAAQVDANAIAAAVVKALPPEVAPTVDSSAIATAVSAALAAQIAALPAAVVQAEGSALSNG